VVFINGTAQTTVNWRPFAQRLKKRGTVVLYDARCQGRSGCGRDTLSLGRHVDDLACLLDALGIARAVLVGLSHGARVALAAAGAMPPRIAGLVLLSLGLAATQRMAQTVAVWREALRNGGLDALVRAMVPSVFGEAFLRQHRSVLGKVADALAQRNDPEKMGRLLAAFDRYPPIEAILPSSPVSALVVAGEDDPLVGAVQARRLAERLEAECRLLPGIGHSIPAEAPEALFDAIETVLISARP
jgi:3-oxoadipate enol-lactonase